MNKLLFILFTLVSTNFNLSGQSYVIPIKHLDAKNLSGVLNHIFNDPLTTCVPNPEKNEIIVDVNYEKYLQIKTLISDLDHPLPTVTLQVWDGEKWLF